jgi:isopentenyl-diphosphate delta-isomerase
MSVNNENISRRKKEHIELCLTDKVSFKDKTNGFDRYDFEHYAITEVKLKKIHFNSRFFGKTINYPFIISCMTGGTTEAENINANLAVSAEELKIPLGVGSQRQALENKEYHKSYQIIRNNAPHIPILGNLGAAEIVKLKDVSSIQYLIDLVEADAFVIHVNPLQELIQKHGEPDFYGFLVSLEKICSKIKTPVIIKEVGSGISKKAAKKLLNCGVKGIDVAGAGGTSWSGVEILRNKDNKGTDFWDWGLPTSYCLKKVSKLKYEFDFMLIGSGGIYNGVDITKAMVLGADITASARIILQKLENDGIDGVVDLIKDWFETVKKIMFLTGCQTVEELKKIKLVKKEELY